MIEYRSSETCHSQYSGSFELAYVQSLAKLSCRTSQDFIRPDFFDHNGNWYRLVEVDRHWVSVKVMKSGAVSWSSSGSVQAAKVHDQIAQILIPIPLSQDAVGHLPAILARRFIDIAPLVHVASASLGEALIKTIIRQVITASQARKLLHRFITQFGEIRTHEGVTYYGFPTLETVVQLPLDKLAACGLGFKARVIQLVAQTLLEDNLEEEVSNVPSDRALPLLRELKGVGYWTARVSLCDLKGDWSLYPFNDLAVRTWASRLWPDGHWPPQESEFRRTWQEINGAYTGSVTFYLLTLGPLTEVCSLAPGISYGKS